MTELNNPSETLWEFPCAFPIKIMGLPEVGLEAFVTSTLKAHVKNHASINIKIRESAGGKYISITAVFEAENREQLDTLYRLLSGHPHAKMVL